MKFQSKSTKSVTVEAEQWFPNGDFSGPEIVVGVDAGTSSVEPSGLCYYVEDASGSYGPHTRIEPGDWVVRYPGRESFVLMPENFEARYRPIAYRYCVYCDGCALWSGHNRKTAAVEYAKRCCVWHVDCGSIRIFDRYARIGKPEIWTASGEVLDVRQLFSLTP